jgi:hypothetical protein
MIDTTPYPAPWCDECVLYDDHWHCLELPHCAELIDREARNAAAREYAALLAQMETQATLRGCLGALILSVPLWAALVALLCWIFLRR